MKLSIIIPVYNVAPYIEEAIESIVCQDFSDYEILLINDGSSDGSERIVDDLAVRYDKIRVFHQTNQGVSVARNLGIENAVGDYLWFVDGDDKLDAGSLVKLHDLLHLYNSPDVLGFNFKYFNLKTDDRQSPDKVELLKPLNGNQFLKYYQRLSGCSFLYKRSLLTHYHIRFREGIMIYEDNLFNIEVFNVSERIIQTNDRLYLYRQNRDGSATQVKDYEKYLDSIVEILRRLENIDGKQIKQQQVDELKLNFLFSFLHNFRSIKSSALNKKYSNSLHSVINKIQPDRTMSKENYVESVFIKLLSSKYLQYHSNWLVVFGKKIIFNSMFYQNK